MWLLEKSIEFDNRYGNSYCWNLQLHLSSDMTKEEAEKEFLRYFHKEYEDYILADFVAASDDILKWKDPLPKKVCRAELIAYFDTHWTKLLDKYLPICRAEAQKHGFYSPFTDTEPSVQELLKARFRSYLKNLTKDYRSGFREELEKGITGHNELDSYLIFLRAVFRLEPNFKSKLKRIFRRLREFIKRRKEIKDLFTCLDTVEAIEVEAGRMSWSRITPYDDEES